MQSFLINRLTMLSIAVQSFVGVMFGELFNPVTQVTPWGLHNPSPTFFWHEHILMLWLSVLVSSLIMVFHCL